MHFALCIQNFLASLPQAIKLYKETECKAIAVEKRRDIFISTSPSLSLIVNLKFTLFPNLAHKLLYITWDIEFII